MAWNNRSTCFLLGISWMRRFIHQLHLAVAGNCPLNIHIVSMGLVTTGLARISGHRLNILSEIKLDPYIGYHLCPMGCHLSSIYHRMQISSVNYFVRKLGTRTLVIIRTVCGVYLLYLASSWLGFPPCSINILHTTLSIFYLTVYFQLIILTPSFLQAST